MSTGSGSQTPSGRRSVRFRSPWRIGRRVSPVARTSPCTAPEVAAGIWRSPERFFRVGGARNWAELLDDRDIAHFNERLRELAGDATDWVLRGRVALDEDRSPT